MINTENLKLALKECPKCKTKNFQIFHLKKLDESDEDTFNLHCTCGIIFVATAKLFIGKWNRRN